MATVLSAPTAQTAARAKGPRRRHLGRVTTPARTRATANAVRGRVARRDRSSPPAAACGAAPPARLSHVRRTRGARVAARL
eukprot:6181042-Prymnesium_polylepis.1